MLSDPSCNALITQDAGKEGKYTKQSWMFKNAGEAEPIWCFLSFLGSN